MIILSRMYKRSIKPLAEFIESNPEPGCYYVDAQFGELKSQKDIAGAITTRIGAGGGILPNSSRR